MKTLIHQLTRLAGTLLGAAFLAAPAEQPGSSTSNPAMPSVPVFPSENPSGDLAPCICGPLVGNYVPGQSERWWVQASGGPLDLRVTVVTVNTNDPQSTIVKVYDGATVVAAVNASYTAAEAAAHGLQWEKPFDLPLGSWPAGKVLRIEASNGGTPVTQTHYWLKWCGAKWVAIDSPSFRALEEDHAAWRFRVAPGEPLVVDLDNVGIPTPATGFAWHLIDPSGSVVGGGTNGIVAGPEFNLAAPAPGLWTLVMQPVGGEHYLLNKPSGADRQIYLDWYTSQRGAKQVRIGIDGHPAGGVPFDVRMLRRHSSGSGYTNLLVASTVTTNGIAGFERLPNGFYDVVVTPLAPGLGAAQSQLDLILCDAPVTNRFDFPSNGGSNPDVKIDYGDAPMPFPTLRADDGARHRIQPGWFLGLGVDADVDGHPSPDMRGDDSSGLSDEDGVVLPPVLVPGATTMVEVWASTNGVLNAWIDFNGDGSWAGPGEQVAHLRPLVRGRNLVPVTVPKTTPGRVASRWRFFRAGGVDHGVTGEAPEGEVEDHPVVLGQRGPTSFNAHPQRAAGNSTLANFDDGLVVANLAEDGSSGVEVEWTGGEDQRWMRFEFRPLALARPGARLEVVQNAASGAGGTSDSSHARHASLASPAPLPSAGLASPIAAGPILLGGDDSITMTNVLGEYAPRTATITWSSVGGVNPPWGEGQVTFQAGDTIELRGDSELEGYLVMSPNSGMPWHYEGAGVQFTGSMNLYINGTIAGSGERFTWYVRVITFEPGMPEIRKSTSVAIRGWVGQGWFEVTGIRGSSAPILPPGLQLKRKAGGQLSIGYEPEIGLDHVLETAADPAGPWTVLDRRVGTLSPADLDLSNEGGMRLFRVRTEQ